MDNVFDAIKRYLNGNGVMRTEPGQTYGPAVTRITRTPVSFAPGANKGEYDPATKTIAIDPTKSTDVPATTRHESIHALLDQVPGSQAMAAQSTGYGDIAKHFAGMGDPRDEAPAYLGAYPTSQFLGLGDQTRQAFLDDLGRRIKGASPSQATTWDRLRK